MANGAEVSQLKVYSGLGAAALKHGHAAEYALWTLARAVDLAGSGRVTDKDLRSAAAAFGWSDFKYRRARLAAVKCGLMTLAGDVLFLVRLDRAALALGASRIGAVPIGVNPRTLSKTKSWRAALRDAYLAGSSTREPKPVSRTAIEAVTGISPRAQSAYNRLNRGALIVLPNYARIAKHFDTTRPLEYIQSLVPGAYYKDGGLWQTLPNTYIVSETAYPRLKRGRVRRAQSSLNFLVNNAAGQESRTIVTLFGIAQGEDDKPIKTARRYHDERRTAFEDLKRAGKGKVKLPDRQYVLGKVRTADNGRPLFALWFSYPDE